ncbi:multidrug DMT transporter [Methanomicrobiaceae archaeon CYW5]|uniref:DMT family transporter n=1 Tax=Methanovulcanius yangii TaxID=1789227 RepID=UPI0029CA6A2F|nr:EamA family transporter [Methanovulcanius yangii]MBT8507546.1 multidrug DMT transporter [Methanovulcanius yangii]
MQNHSFNPVIYAVLAAMLFGSCAPAAKYLLAGIGPVMLAGLLYLGSGAGLALYLGVCRLRRQDRNDMEAPLAKADLPWLAGVILFGGILAPVVLLISLEVTPAATAALLLNFEAVATTILAAAFFKEYVGRNVWTALALITASCAVLSYSPTALWGFSLGAVGILLACTFWSLDNNISRNIAAKDPIPIVAIKGLVAGAVIIASALLMGGGLPALPTVAGVMVVGFFSYGGITSVLFMMALRGIGTARTGSILAVSPFFGVAISFAIFEEPLASTFWIALPIMVVGAYLLITENHSHPHYHPPMEHEHRHCHDDGHHLHAHVGTEPPLSANGEHSHRHFHEEMTHEHPHQPDLHHRHGHGKIK